MISQDTSKMSLDFHYSLGEIFGSLVNKVELEVKYFEQYLD
jgi:hypothetical protein